MDRITNPPARTRPRELAFHASRIIIDVGVLICMAAMSMPFVTTEGTDRTSMAADALPVILLLMPIFLVTLLPDHTKPIPRPLGWVSLLLGVVAFPYAVVKYLDAANLAETLGGSVGFGPRLLIFGTFVTVSGISIGLSRVMLRSPAGGTHLARRPAPTPPGTEPHRHRPAGAQSGRARTARPAPRQRPKDPETGAGPGER